MINLVQQTGNNTGSTSPTIVLTWPAAPTPGNMIIVGMGHNGITSAPTCTNVAFTSQVAFAGDASHDSISLWTGLVNGASSTTMTLTSGTSTEWAAIAVEISAMTFGAIEGSVNSGNLSSTSITGGSLTPKSANNFLFAFSTQKSGATPTSRPGNGWIDLTDALQTSGLTIGGTAAYKIVGDTGTPETATWGYSGSQFGLGVTSSVKRAPLQHNQRYTGENLRPHPFSPGLAR